MGPEFWIRTSHWARPELRGTSAQARLAWCLVCQSGIERACEPRDVPGTPATPGALDVPPVLQAATASAATIGATSLKVAFTKNAPLCRIRAFGGFVTYVCACQRPAPR